MILTIEAETSVFVLCVNIDTFTRVHSQIFPTPVCGQLLLFGLLHAFIEQFGKVKG